MLSREAGTPLGQALDCATKDEGYQSWSLLVDRNSVQSAANNSRVSKSQITAVPLGRADRAEFVETANEVFEIVLYQIEAENQKATGTLWDAERYVDEVLLKEDMLPVDHDYALSLNDAFPVHYVTHLAVQADKQAAER